MRISPLLFSFVLLADDKPPVIPETVLVAYSAAELSVEKAEAQLNLILAKEERMRAIRAIVVSCGDRFQPLKLPSGEVRCQPKPPAVAPSGPAEPKP